MNVRFCTTALRMAGTLAACVFLALAPAANAQKKPSGGGSDPAAPAQITQLWVEYAGFEEAALIANVTGDDGMTGTATATELRYRKAAECDYDAATRTAKLAGTQTDCFTDTNWATLSGKSYGSPPAPGVRAAFITDLVLTPGTGYLFALRMVDETGKRSPVSPVVSGETMELDTMMPWASASSFATAGDGLAPRSSLAFSQGQPAAAFSWANDYVRFTRSYDGGATWTAPLTTESGTGFGLTAKVVALGGTAGAAEFGVAYGGSGSLRYRTVTGAAWSGAYETIVSGRNTTYRANALLMAAGQPFTAYSCCTSPTSGITLARRLVVNGKAEWRQKAFTPGSTTDGWDFALAVDPADPTGSSLGMVYTTRTAVTGGKNYDTYYMTITLGAPASSTDAGITWGTPQLVASAPYAPPSATSIGSSRIGYTPSLAFVGGEPFVVHGSGPSRMTKGRVSRREAGAWAHEELGYWVPDGMQSDVMVDASGAVSVALWRENVAAIAHRAEGGGWAFRLLTPAMGNGFNAHAVGPDGPATVYFYRPASGPEELRYAVASPLVPAVPAPALDLVPVAAPLADTSPFSVYPNPFTDRTTLRFRLLVAGRAALVVYDLLGREVVRPLDSDVEAGTHAVPLDASGLVAGTYVVRLQAGGAVQTRTITIAR